MGQKSLQGNCFQNNIGHPFNLGPCDFSPLFADFIDKYGVRWCLFV